MSNYIIGFCLGVVTTSIVALGKRHRHKTTRRVTLEQEYIVLQGHVNKAVESIDRIINRS